MTSFLLAHRTFTTISALCVIAFVQGMIRELFAIRRASREQAILIRRYQSRDLGWARDVTELGEEIRPRLSLPSFKRRSTYARIE